MITLVRTIIHCIETDSGAVTGTKKILKKSHRRRDVSRGTAEKCPIGEERLNTCVHRQIHVDITAEGVADRHSPGTVDDFIRDFFRVSNNFTVRHIINKPNVGEAFS